MAEPFGIAAAFTTCVDCFGYIQLGRHFGRDFQTDLLVLNCTRLRLTRWGEAVSVYTDPYLGRPDATADELKTAKNTLHQILVLFAATEKVSKKYRLSAKARQDLATLSADDMDPVVISLTNKMRELATKRQKGSSIHKITKLIENIVLLIDSLENLFPSPGCIALAKQEAAEIANKRALELTESAATGVDTMLHDAAKEALTGHQYLNLVVNGKAKIGDTFSSDWKGRALGASNCYEGIEVGEKGKASLGTKYGGKDFWED
ncbi:small s protein [Lindgomyces ingoldianus]|uniref:Small s protein n=1 Tax=Lindgomyces ingoldianus TaxID=673940 RepID=A0ACB6QNK1_9PLEO|nr:small s protein [Lindgomyces ingoldianus]KAF2467862.1 small s protein [Lindgomyces ingoldianus]